jgi:hypothetical protein
VILLLTAVPVAAIAAARTTDHLALRQARAQQAAVHRVGAVLTQAAPANAAPNPYVAVEDTWVPARWTAPNGSSHSGTVLAPYGTPKGSTVQAWINASGAIADAPANGQDVIGNVVIAVTATTLALTFLLLGVQALTCRALDRRASGRGTPSGGLSGLDGTAIASEPRRKKRGRHQRPRHDRLHVTGDPPPADLPDPAVGQLGVCGRAPRETPFRNKRCPAMSATLKVTHKAIGAEVRRGPYDVVFDGERVGSVEMNDTFETPVEPGRHTLQVRNGRNSSRTKTFDAADGETVAFRCTGKSILPIFLASFVVPSLALTLKRD